MQLRNESLKKKGKIQACRDSNRGLCDTGDKEREKVQH